MRTGIFLLPLLPGAASWSRRAGLMCGHADTAIRDAQADDAAAIAALYNHYVDATVVTFELDPVAPADMRARIARVQAQGLPWLLAERAGEALGYAYAAPWRTRPAYRHSVETSVYLAPQATGQGLGSALYRALLARLQACGAHAAIGGIALPNAASVRLHERLGFAKVAHFRQVGRKFGQWVDVGYWQLLLEHA